PSRPVLTPPGGEVFPSRVPPAQQPAGRVIDPQGSCGNSFIISGTQSEPVRFDVPLDRASAGGLLIHKSADRITAEVGDFVDYTVQINNASAGALAGTLVNDLLPAGFSYVRGSARLNGAALPDPAGGAGPALQFSLGILAQGAQATLSYRVRLGVGAQGGSGVNSAQAVSGSLASNRASAAVQVVGGVFDSKAYLIGKVFADCNGNGVQDPEEPGVPGVRIYLEDGTYAVTDEQGKYSLYGLIPRLHVAKVDASTLPAGTRLEVLGNRNALDANSAFVDLTNGELHKTDFGLAGCPAGLREQIEARRQALKTPSEILQLSRTLFSENNTHLTATDARTAPASGAIQLPGAAPGPAGNTSPVAPLAMASGMAGITPFAGSPAPLGAVADPGGPYAPQAQGVPLPPNVPARARCTPPAGSAAYSAGRRPRRCRTRPPRSRCRPACAMPTICRGAPARRSRSAPLSGAGSGRPRPAAWIAGPRAIRCSSPAARCGCCCCRRRSRARPSSARRAAW